MEVPTATSLRDLYPEDVLEFQQKRWEDLLSKFQTLYGRPAAFVARSPGRVNVIGEHIDYSLYEVLPMAVVADMLLAVAPSEPPANKDSLPRVRIANANSDKFPSRDFEIPSEGDVEIDPSASEWTNYFKAGLRGASALLRKTHGDADSRYIGMDVLADGTVPSGGGLSSSAAFVCASALAVMKANGEEKVDKTELVELAVVSERAVGVNSGGMDQSASVFSQRGTALYVSFKPSLTSKPISFPETDPPFSFIVAQSLVTSVKRDTAPVCYNLRVVECTLAAVFLAKAFGLKKPLPTDASPLGVSLRGFHDTYFEEREGIADNTKTNVHDFAAQLNELLVLTDDYLSQEEGYSREQICGLLGITIDELEQHYMTKFPIRAEKFKLRQRAMHVFSEALRVIKFLDLLEETKDNKQGEDLLRRLGTLLNESQASCRDIYDCSCPELDELCDLARSAGAYGSRLTGAGWGGASVHLVPTAKVEAVRQKWIEKYYKKKWPNITDAELEDAIVVSSPGSGSAHFLVTGGKVV